MDILRLENLYYTTNGRDKFDRAVQWLANNAPITEVELVVEWHYDYPRLAFKLEPDIWALSPNLGNFPNAGGFLIDSDIFGRTVSETWMGTAALDIPIYRPSEDSEWDDYAIVATKQASGIRLTDYFPAYAEGTISDFDYTLLEYVHPNALDALTSDLPPETWTPPIHLSAAQRPVHVRRRRK